MKGADQVLAAGMVHPRFAADGGIDHGQKGGGDLNHPDPTQPGGCCEAGHVSDNPSTQGQHQRAALQALPKGGVMDGGHRGWSLAVFSRINHQQIGVEALEPQALQAFLSIGGGDVRVADHQDPSAGLNCGVQEFVPKAAQATGADHHLIGVAFQGDGDPTQGG